MRLFETAINYLKAQRNSFPAQNRNINVFQNFSNQNESQKYFQGDLAKKKIFPTLWWLYRDRLLPDHIVFVGYARSKLTLEKLRESFEKHCKVRENEKERFEKFIKCVTYISGQYDSDEGFQTLAASFDAIELKLKSKKTQLTIIIIVLEPLNRLFYLALPPNVFESVTTYIKKHCMDKG